MKGKILFIEDYLDPNTGGVQRVTWSLANFLSDNGFESYFCYSGYDYEPISERLKIRLNFYNEDKEFLYAQLRNFVLKNGISIIIVQNIATEQMCYCLKTLCAYVEIKTVYCFHKNPISAMSTHRGSIVYRLKVKVYNILNGVKPQYDFIDIINLVDKYVVLSPTYITMFKRLYGIDVRQKFLSIPNAIPFEMDCLDIVSKEKMALIITRFQENVKNIKGALDIWKQFEVINSEWVLVIGGYGEDYDEVYNYFEKLKLKRCKFIGKIDNPKDYYRRASIYMMTSRYEGYPMALLEAMEFGCVPIVYDTFTSLHDILTNDKEGIIVKPYSKKEYVNALKLLTKDEKFRNRLAVAAYEKMKHNNTKEIIGQLWLELLTLISHS